jgi:hypothetical protein
MKRVGELESGDHATKYLALQEPLEIERHGRPVGDYIPVQRPNEAELR